MAIRPVSMVSFAGNNSLNFQAKKKKHSQATQGHSNANRLTVPLAAALTMMPLNVLNAEKPHARDFDSESNKIESVENIKSSFIEENSDDGVVLGSKSFTSDKYGSYSIKLVSTDGNDRNFEKVVMVTKDKNFDRTHESKVESLAQYNYKVVSDDGSTGSKFSFKKVLVEGLSQSMPFTYSQEELVKYIGALAKDARNNGAFEEKTYNRSLRPSSEGTLQNVAGGDIMKNAVPKDSYGKFLTELNLTDDNGNKTHTLRFYSTDDNEDNAEAVTLQRNGYPELQIAVVYVANQVFNPNEEEPYEFQDGVVVLAGKEGKPYYLENIPLARLLYKLREENDIKNAYPIFGTDVNYIVTPKGAVMPSVQE